MVNTFLTHEDFATSAATLDRQRLGKQRVEAYQVLNIIDNLGVLGQVFNFPYEEHKYRLTLNQWIKTVIDFYKKEPYVIVIRESEPFFLDKKLKTSEYLQQGDRQITLGFIHHACVRMWFGYTDALKAYINEHIFAWKSRNYQNNMKIYDIPASYDRPKWTYDPEVHRMFRAALLAKEIERKEPTWYQLKPEFVGAGEFVKYTWPSVDADILPIASE